MSTCIKLFIILVFSSSAYSESFELKDFIRLSIEKDQKYQELHLEKEKNKYIKDQSMPADAISLTLDHEKAYVLDSDDTNQSSTISLSKNFSKSGTSISVSKSRSNQPNIEFEEFDVSIEQSLLKNSFGRDARLLEAKLEEEAELANKEQDEAYEDYLLESIAAFFDYQITYSKYLLAKNTLADTKKLNRQVSQKYKKQIATSTDYQKSQLELLTAEEDFLAMEKDLNLMKAKVTERTGLKEVAHMPGEMKKLFSKLLEWESKSLDKNLIREKLIADGKLSIAKKELEILKRDNWAELNLVAGYSEEESVRYSNSVNQKENYVGLSFSMPFSDKQSAANIGIARLDEEKLKVSRDLAERSIDRQILEFKQQLKFYSKNIELLDKKLALAKNIYKAENNRYSYGKIDLDTLIERKKDLATYQYQYQEYLLSYLSLSASWLELNDNLIEFTQSL